MEVSDQLPKEEEQGKGDHMPWSKDRLTGPGL